MGAPQYEQAGADIGGTGTTNTIPRWTGPTTLGDSGFVDDGSTIAAASRMLAIGTSGTTGARVWIQNNTSGNTLVLVSPSGTGAAFGQLIEAGTNASDYALNIRQRGTANPLAYVRGDGNVGIGTASPGALLHLSSAATTLRVTSTTSTNSCVMRVEAGGGNVYIGRDSSAGGFSGTASASIFWDSIAQPMVFGTNNTERARIDSSGNLILNTANTGATIQAAGSQQGLKLPATPGNADTQTLDCYQENTGWVPTITFGGASTGMTYTTQAGSWTKIGNLVFVTGRIVLSAKGSSTGVARLANLPVAVGASNASGGGMVGPVANITFGGQLAIYAVASATTLGLAKNTSAGAAVDLTDADFTNTSDITFSCIYRV